jgi:hypothetical protein
LKVALLNLEPKYLNYALEKLRIYHASKGDLVEDYMPLNYVNYDRIYCSSIFSFTPKENLPPNAVRGGTGFDLTTVLPDEIEAIEPHLNFGFTTRGCIRHCKFCIVRIKEGYIRIICKLKALWDGISRQIVLFDNNILAVVDHFFSICQEANDYKVELDFNQGLDYRLLNQNIVDALKSIRHHEYRFAFDSPDSYSGVSKAINLLQSNGINRCLWYVLVGFDTTFQQDLDRLNFLKDNGQNAYVQRYNHRTNKQYTSLARWVNQHHIFQGMTWEQFTEKERVLLN